MLNRISLIYDHWFKDLPHLQSSFGCQTTEIFKVNSNFVLLNVLQAVQEMYCLVMQLTTLQYDNIRLFYVDIFCF